MQHDDIDWELLARCLGRTGSDADREALQRWIAGDEARQAFVATAERLWADLGRRRSPPRDPDAAWQRLSQAMATAEETDTARRWLSGERSIPAAHPRRAWLPAMVRTAAMLVVAVGLTLLWRIATQPGPAQPPIRAVATRTGQRAIVQLRDGSRVIVGPQSELRVAADFDERSRNVYLTGEAYFEVAHDSTRPFRVHASGAVTQVLGTKFSVRAIAPDEPVEVAVAEGRVALRTDNGQRAPIAFITRGETGTLHPGRAPIVTRVASLDPYLAWTDGRLVFDDTPLPEVVRQLDRWYDVQFRIGDPSLATLHLTATFGQESPSEVTLVLDHVLDVRSERHENVVVLLPKRPAGRHAAPQVTKLTTSR